VVNQEESEQDEVDGMKKGRRELIPQVWYLWNQLPSSLSLSGDAYLVFASLIFLPLSTPSTITS